MSPSRLAAAAIGCALAWSCGSGPTVPVIGDPFLNCPADLTVNGHNGQQPTVAFDTPVASQGSPPVRVVCTPTSGTPFPNGLTTVTCEATDAQSRKASCSFSVVVTPIPQLSKTTFLAFGDSITEGVLALQTRGAVVVPPGTFDTSSSYVEKLYPKLANRYQDQTVTLIAFGFGGEGALAGAVRLQTNWSRFNPDAVLMLEGTNDLTSGLGSSAAVDALLRGLQNAVEFAKSKGARVFLATLVPITAPNSQAVIASVQTANARIRVLAAAENVTLVDLNAAVPDIYIGGGKGLHPTEQGYEIMADEWFKSIVATMELKTSALPQILAPVRDIR